MMILPLFLAYIISFPRDGTNVPLVKKGVMRMNKGSLE